MRYVLLDRERLEGRAKLIFHSGWGVFLIIQKTLKQWDLTQFFGSELWDRTR